jgi:hypothetical protein
VLVHDYTDDWYYRIHVIPQTIDFGNLQTTQTEQFLVWNAFFDARELTSVAFTPPPGLSLELPAGVEPLPYDIKPLEVLTFEITGTTAGPPIIEGEIDLVIDGGAFEVAITGRRIILFPFKPNWKMPFDETFVFNSWVLTNGDESEQTGSIWGNRPRRNFDYAILLKAHQAQRFDSILAGWQTRLYGVIHWAEKSKLTAAVIAGGTVLQLDTSKLTLREGNTIVLYQDDETNDSRQVASWDATSITLTTGVQQDWPAGTHVHPSFVAAIGPFNGTRLTDGVTQGGVSFECEPSVTESHTEDDGAALTYRGEELYLERINWGLPMSFSFESAGVRVDRNVGKFKLFGVAEHGIFSRGHNWTLRNHTEVAAFRAFLGRREGVARPVYMPSGTMDFTLLEALVNPASSMDVRANEYATLLAEHPTRRDVLILLRDGTYYARRITDVAIVSNTVTRLFFDTPIAADVAVAAVKRISYLGYYRQAGNATTLRWLTDEVATVQMQLKNKVTP